MKHVHYIIAILLFSFVCLAYAEEPLPSKEVSSWQKWGPTTGLVGGGFIARAGYVIGGTTPLPLPAEVRRINSFSPRGGVSLGIDGYRMFSKRWGVSLGAHFFWEGFYTSADVKNYYVWLEMKEGATTDTQKGYFTGTNTTETEMWGFTVPLLATYRISPRWNVSFGPYLSYYFKQTFTGEVSENRDGVGYLRDQTPTGAKIPAESPYPDNFADNMVPMSAGLELGFDWKALRHMNVFGLLDWGLTNIWNPNFEAISFKMYPIYGTIGVAYRY